MRFQVPQFIEIEDKIFGPLTIKQFIYIAGGAGLCFILFRLLPLIIVIPLGVVVIASSLALAFYQINNKPVLYIVQSAVGYFFSSKLYLWKKKEISPEKTIQPTALPGQTPIYVPRLSKSKLHDLTWSLDIKESLNPVTQEEKSKHNLTPTLSLTKERGKCDNFRVFLLPSLDKEGLREVEKSETCYNKKSMDAAKTTQEFVPIKEVRDGVIIMKDNSMRAIVLSSSLNFALKSTDEQEAIIYQFQNFLNSLDFSVQISVQSRQLDIRPYLATLDKRYNDELNDLLKIQIKEYIQFVKNFTENQNIMSKTFFIVIPFTPTMLNSKKESGLGKFLPSSNSNQSKNIKTDNFEENRTQLEQRVSVVQQGLMRCGIRSVSLGTEETIELFYKLFNPGDTEKPIKL